VNPVSSSPIALRNLLALGISTETGSKLKNVDGVISSFRPRIISGEVPVTMFDPGRGAEVRCWGTLYVSLCEVMSS
jgi:hypothetical protein